MIVYDLDDPVLKHIILDAADYLETNPWCQDAIITTDMEVGILKDLIDFKSVGNSEAFKRTMKKVDEVCAIGALLVTAPGIVDWERAIQLIEYNGLEEQSLAAWNDEPGRTVEEVQTLFRYVAELSP